MTINTFNTGDTVTNIWGQTGIVMKNYEGKDYFDVIYKGETRRTTISHSIFVLTKKVKNMIPLNTSFSTTKTISQAKKFLTTKTIPKKTLKVSTVIPETSDKPFSISKIPLIIVGIIGIIYVLKKYV